MGVGMATHGYDWWVVSAPIQHQHRSSVYGPMQAGIIDKRLETVVKVKSKRVDPRHVTRFFTGTKGVFGAQNGRDLDPKQAPF
jgi:hypothetical protein